MYKFLPTAEMSRALGQRPSEPDVAPEAWHPVTILLEGLDLSGKTTLARALTSALRETGWRAHHHRGLLSPVNPMRPLMHAVSASKHPGSSALNLSYLVACALDRLLPSSLLRGRDHRHVLVQESYVDRSIAYGIARGPWPAAAIALRCSALFPSFDLVIYLHAPLQVRRERLHRRTDLNEIDRVSVASGTFQRDFMVALQRAGERHRHARVYDTSQRSVAQIVEDVLAWVAVT